MPFNHKLASSTSFEEIINLGFTEQLDGTGDPRGTSYHYKNEKFHICINAWFDVELARVNHDTDFITIQVYDKSELEDLMNFIK